METEQIWLIIGFIGQTIFCIALPCSMGCK